MINHPFPLCGTHIMACINWVMIASVLFMIVLFPLPLAISTVEQVVDNHIWTRDWGIVTNLCHILPPFCLFSIAEFAEARLLQKCVSSIVQGPSQWTSLPARQKVPRLSRNPKINDRFHKRLPLVPNPVETVYEGDIRWTSSTCLKACTTKSL
jgi:hypothetical protein